MLWWIHASDFKRRTCIASEMESRPKRAGCARKRIFRFPFLTIKQAGWGCHGGAPKPGDSFFCFTFYYYRFLIFDFAAFYVLSYIGALRFGSELPRSAPLLTHAEVLALPLPLSTFL